MQVGDCTCVCVCVLAAPAATLWSRTDKTLTHAARASIDDSASCYTEPGLINHLSKNSWLGTLRLLVLCAVVQAVLTVLAVVWDVMRTATRFRASDLFDSDEKYTWRMVALDCIQILTTFASCGTFMIRTYEHDEYRFSTTMRASIMWIDLGCTAIYLLRYLYKGCAAASKFQFVVSGISLLDVLSIVSVLAVAVEEDLWLPFSFLRALSLSTTMQRVFSLIDLSEISEQLAVTAVECFVFVYVYAHVYA